MECECGICQEPFSLSDIVSCTGSSHYRCLACHEDAMEALLNDAKPVREDGDVPCAHCDGVYSFATLRPRLSASLFQRYNGAMLQSREQALAERYREEMARFMQQSEVERHVKHVRDAILRDQCPRCHLSFDYDGGCLALKCPNCQCGFCAYCGHDQGDDSHTHTADCAFNTAERNVFPPGRHNRTKRAQRAYYAEHVRKPREVRMVQQYLEGLGAKMREEVAEKLQ